jgi:hypothetical protein
LDILNRIIHDENSLFKKGGKALIPPNSKTLSYYRLYRYKIVGEVPDSLKATFVLMHRYKKKFKEAEAEADKTELAGLVAAVEYRWKTRWADCCESVEKTNGGIVILKDWSIVALTLTVR